MREPEFCTFMQAVALKRIGFNEPCRCYYQLKAHSKRRVTLLKPRGHNDSLDCFSAPSLHHAAKWLREELGVDLVISPRFNSRTADRIGYFWRWSQRTDVNMHPKTHNSYEAALSNAISTVLDQFNVT